jgi:Putative beta-lactamase-inhibitor-like, PepSY-like
MRFICVVGSGGLASLLILSAFAGADEVKVPLKDVPKAVLDSVKAKFPRGELTGAVKESEDGKTTYEIALKDGGRAVDLAATADGKITEIETTIDAKALPAKVTSALGTKYPKATIKKAEEIVEIKDGKETKSFEVIVMTTAEKSLEVKVTPEGKILAEAPSAE